MAFLLIKQIIMFISTKQVAEKLQCTKMTVTRLVRKGVLTPVNPQKEYFLFDESEVELFNSKRLNNAK